MSIQAKIKRFYLIIEKIGNSKFSPTFNEIKGHLEDQGLKLSHRTLQRDIEILRDEFGLKIDYDKIQNVYRLDEENSYRLDSFLKILNTALTAEILVENLKDIHNLGDYIQLQNEINLKGLENLKSLLFAVHSHRVIHFDYTPFYREKAKQHTVEPYLLKEYMGRWYVIGIDTDINEFRIYGIERIEMLEVSTRQFVRNEKSDPKQLFDHVVGLNFNYADIEEVILNVTPIQWRYIKTQPIHKSQELIRESESEYIVRLTLIPNYEFIQRILMNASGVHVIKPLWLREKVIELLRETLKRYEDE
ncbi:MAG: helix-turn-helix transcriptional regulator [bacterium]